MKTNLKLHLLLVFFLALGSQKSLFAQPVVTTNAAPYNTVQGLVGVLTDATIVTSNHSSYGAPMQMGFFSGGTTVLQMDSGICMSNGNIAGMATGGAGFNSTAIPAGANQGGGDPDLLTVAASVPGLIGATFSVNSTWNAAIIEFDFIPVSDTIEFRYSMASEEWHNWTCTTFNDVFGFFVSGPGITGPYSSPLGFPGGAMNVATVPGSNPALPVTISTIHNGTGFGVPNCANPLNTNFFLPNGNNTNFNASTTVLTAKFGVIQCNTYHMKLAIADGSDQIFDSGVYLEANSFTGSGLSIVASPTYTNPNFSAGGNGAGDTIKVYEGCGAVDLLFIRHSDSIALADTINFDLIGSATNGGDFTFLNTFILFPPNQDSTTITFNVFNDGLPEGTEYVTFLIDSTSNTGCNNDSTTITFELCDVPIPQLTMGPDTTLNCTQDSAVVLASITGGLPPFTYVWNTLNTDSTFNALPPNTTTYSVTATDACGVETVSGSQTVTMYSPPWGLRTYNDQVTLNCTSNPVQLAVGITDNFYPGFGYTWLDANGDTISNDSTATVFSLETTQYTAYVDHYCVPPNNASRTFDVLVQNDQMTLEADDVDAEPYIVCPGDPVPLTATTFGGYPGYKVWWSTGGTGLNEIVTPKLTDTIQVFAHDTCALDTMVHDVIVTVPIPDPFQILNVETDTINCPDDIIYLGRTMAALGGTGVDANYIFSWNGFQDTNPIKKVVLKETSSHTIQVTDVCHFDTLSLDISLILRENDPLQLNLPEDFNLCPGQEYELVAMGENGGGNYTYQWYPDNMTSNSRMIAPNKTTEYTVRVMDECDSFRLGTVTVNVQPIKAAFDYNYVADYQVDFANRSTGKIDNYVWSFGDGDISREANPTHEYFDGEEHAGVLIVSNELGCADTAYKAVMPTLWLWIPNSFTPNGDNLNDIFKIEGLAMQEYELMIFDRWGSQVYFEDENSVRKGWDGTVNGNRAPMGAYVYRVTVLGDDGQLMERTGTVTLVNDLRER